MKLSKLIVTTVLAFCLPVGIASAIAADATGVWLTESKKAHVEIYNCGADLCGKIVWLKEPNDDAGKPKTDKENPDEALRSAPLLGSNMITGMKMERPGRWVDGSIYNAEDGKTYDSVMDLTNPSTLKVAGCVFIFCKDQVWTKVP